MMMTTTTMMMYTVHRTVSVALSEEKEEVCVELRTSALNKTLHALCCALARPTYRSTAELVHGAGIYRPTSAAGGV